MTARQEVDFFVREIQRINSPTTVDILVRALIDDDDPWVHMAAAEALGWIGDPEALPALQQALETDKDPRVRSAAAEALKQTPLTTNASGLRSATS